MQEFFLTPDSGILEPYGSATVSISFTSIVQADYRTVPPKIFVEYSDSEGLDRTASLPVEISAEAYQVSTMLTFADQDSKGTLNYGDMKVGASASKTFKLKNEGKYSIDFNFVIRKKSTEELFKIEPRQGVLTPGTDIGITVSFTSKQEVTLKDNKDIRCNIIESVTKENVKDFDLSVSVRSVFDKFRLQPLKGINFGAVHYGEERSKRFELKNNGDFDFEYRVVPLAVAQNEQDERERGVVVAPWKPPTEPLVIGQFKISPAGGKITPGQTASIEIVFNAKGSEVFRQTLRIDVSNRDPYGSDAGLQYDIVGESCIPGISAGDNESIFEEQSVVRELALGSTGVLPSCVYALEEKTFSFGQVVPTARPNGIHQRFKISNPNKVRAVVKYSVDPRIEKEAGIYSVQPKSDDIPPHEHRYVSVYFKPTAVQKYQALFKAVVDNGIDPTSNKLQFDLLGEGTLPCITIVQPLIRTPTGELLLDFGRLQVNKSRTKHIQIRNDGSVPVTITYDIPVLDSFFCNKRGTTSTLNPGDGETVDVVFNPRVTPDKAIEALMNLTIAFNSFETNRVLLRGVSYKEQVTFDDLPEDREGELVFVDQDLIDNISGQNASFTVRNHTTQPVKFEWLGHPDFSFSPAVGHLQPHSTKDITGTFKSSTGSTVSFDKEKITMKVTSIKYSDKVLAGGIDPDWDCRMKQGDGSLSLPEPEFTPAGEATQLTLLCTARADRVSFKCEMRNLSFKPTFMFQSRSHKFEVTNTAKTTMDLTWSIDNLKGAGIWGDVM
jgi:hydrocephalus-inducing protein